jgi:hypothetical protein
MTLKECIENLQSEIDVLHRVSISTIDIYVYNDIGIRLPKLRSYLRWMKELQKRRKNTTPSPGCSHCESHYGDGC